MKNKLIRRIKAIALVCMMTIVISVPVSATEITTAETEEDVTSAPVHFYA